MLEYRNVHGQEISSKVALLDLDPILYSLVNNPEGPMWSSSKAMKAEVWYRRFLTLIGTYSGEVIVPTKEIDDVWHTHILDTRKYIQDCDFIFGEYLHHFPYLGTRGIQDKLDLESAFTRTLALFQFHWNDIPLDTASLEETSICSACSNCGPLMVKGINLEVRPAAHLSNSK